MNSPKLSTETPTRSDGSILAAPLESDERWRLAARVAASSEFRKSARLRDFLLYICEKTLTGRMDEIREQPIGSAVFGRRPDYNSSEDNIVRVEARELRKRLDRYFDGEGRADSFRIRIPKPGYVPVFEPQAVSQSQTAGLTPRVERTHQEKYSPEKPSGNTGRSRWIIAALALAVVFLSGIIFRNWETGRRAERRSESAGSASNAPASIWPLLFGAQHATSIVVSDCPLVLVQRSAGKQIPLADYTEGRYLAQLKKPMIWSVASGQLTSLADSIIVARIAETAIGHHGRVTVRYARDLRPRDLENGNLIFLGSSYTDPWITEFDAERNFQVEVDRRTGMLFYLNRAPIAGELRRYYARGESGHSNETYGLITFLPNLRHNGNVLILEGTTTEGTEAAGDFMTDPHFSSKLPEYLGLSRNTKTLPYFELLLKTKMLSGASTQISVVAHRVIHTL